MNMAILLELILEDFAVGGAGPLPLVTDAAFIHQEIAIVFRCESENANGLADFDFGYFLFRFHVVFLFSFSTLNRSNNYYFTIGGFGEVAKRAISETSPSSLLRE